MQVAWVRSLGGDPICLMVLPNPHQKRTSYFHTARVVKIISFKKLLIHTHHTGITFSFPEHHKHIRHLRFADLPNPGIEPTSLTSLALQADSLELGHGGSPKQLERSYEKVWRGINDRSGSFLIWSNGGNEMSLKAIFLVFQRVPGKQKHLPPQQTPAESHLHSPLVSRQLLGAAEANEHSGRSLLSSSRNALGSGKEHSKKVDITEKNERVNPDLDAALFPTRWEVAQFIFMLKPAKKF